MEPVGTPRILTLGGLAAKSPSPPQPHPTGNARAVGDLTKRLLQATSAESGGQRGTAEILGVLVIGQLRRSDGVPTNHRPRMEAFAQYLWLVPAGLLLGIFGTLIGAGGGFLLVPLLLLLYPSEQPEVITSISLAVVGINAISGSVSYARMKRINYTAGALFALASIPGAVLGTMTTTVVPPRVFHAVLGAVLVLAAGRLLWRPHTPRGQVLANEGSPTNGGQSAPPSSVRFNRPLGALLSVGVGYVSSLLGIGGGIIHVPALVHLLGFPVHTATATSHFVLAFMAGAGTATHIVTGAFHHGARRTLMLGLGAAIGAPLGAALSRRMHGTWIIQALGAALLLAGLRVLIWA